MRGGLDRYRARWGALPQTHVDPDWPDLAVALRRRLGLRADATAEVLAGRLREFQQVHGLRPSGKADANTLDALNAGADYYLRRIALNLRRAAAIPGGAERSILVDTASARLWMYERDRAVAAMPVVVGKREMPTPVVFGVIRYAAYNPYWNVPADLARDSIAPAVLREGPRYLAAHRFELLSDWSPDARPLDPAQVDWRAVADGATPLRVRQRPGGDNMMGAVKFMLPNPLGIYLHDTPARYLFDAADRHHSSGCVRLSDAPGLARWLFGGAPVPAGGAEERIDLPAPVPVFIAYLTALPDGEGVRFAPDVYGRDTQALGRPDPALGDRGSEGAGLSSSSTTSRS